MTTETAASAAVQAETGTEASAETKALNAAIDAEDGANTEDKQPEPQKKEKTAEEREIARLRRRVDNLTRRLYEGGHKGSTQQVASTQEPRGTTNTAAQDDDEPVQLTRKQLREIEERARDEALTTSQQSTDAERRSGVANQLAKDWGREKFDAYAADLDDALGGLTDARGAPRPATNAIFDSDNPRALIEYLTNPDHADEADALGRMSVEQANRAIGRIEARLAADKGKAKPQPSSAPAPIEQIRAQGKVAKSLFDLSGDEFDKRRREQVAKRGKF
ncbi:MAG: hypothetical protein KIH64_006265 [Mycobacterium sp.]|nr:hypothetical protein [Mycobacterium sp.]